MPEHIKEFERMIAEAKADVATCQDWLTDSEKAEAIYIQCYRGAVVRTQGYGTMLHYRTVRLATLIDEYQEQLEMTQAH